MKESPYPAITAALNRVPWAKFMQWIVWDIRNPGWWAFWGDNPDRTPLLATWGWVCSRHCDDAIQVVLPDWPGDWRDSLHRVEHHPDGCKVVWVGRSA